MKKLTTIIALALLAVAGTGYAVTCAYDNVPGATLLVPYWKVSANGTTGGNISAIGTDTLCAITNVSGTGIIVHATLWNKYSRALLDWNIPMSGWDTTVFSMRDVLNGNLNSNPTHQWPIRTGVDACGANHSAVNAGITGSYRPSVGWAQKTFIRFSNPDTIDAWGSIANYSLPAYSGSFRYRVWQSLDESGEITSFTDVTSPYIIDSSNQGCNGIADADGNTDYDNDFTGYLTLDVNNFCSRLFPHEPAYWQRDAMATVGWLTAGYTPNCIMGDVFHVEDGVIVSGENMVSLEFDVRLEGALVGTASSLLQKTFYGKYWVGNNREAIGPYAAFDFVGDGREPLQNHFGYRFYNFADAIPTQTWITVWRSDVYNDANGTNVNLCIWWNSCRLNPASANCVDKGLYDSAHELVFRSYDMDENYSIPQGQGGPSGDTLEEPDPLYVFLETQRIALLGNKEINPDIAGNVNVQGWTDIYFPGTTNYNQTWMGVQHKGPSLGSTMDVGHDVTILDNQFLCPDLGGGTIFGAPGNIIN